MKTYTPAPDEVHERVTALVSRYYPDLQAVQAKIDILFVTSDQVGSALKHHGYPCSATIRIVGLRDRSKGHGDAEIIIEADKYASLTPESRDALLDHELYHLEPVRDKKTKFFKIDSHGRPKFKLRLHDRQFGWFDTIATRHGEASVEVNQAKEFFAEAGQLYFDLSETESQPARPSLAHRLSGLQKVAAEHGAVISIRPAGSEKEVIIDRSGVRSATA